MYSNILKIMQYKYIFMAYQTMSLYQTMSTTSMEQGVDTCLRSDVHVKSNCLLIPQTSLSKLHSAAARI